MNEMNKQYETASEKARETGDIAVAILLEAAYSQLVTMRQLFLETANLYSPASRERDDERLYDEKCVRYFGYLITAFKRDQFVTLCDIHRVPSPVSIAARLFPFLMELWQKTVITGKKDFPHYFLTPEQAKDGNDSSFLLPKTHRAMLAAIASHWELAETWPEAEPAFRFLLSIVINGGETGLKALSKMGEEIIREASGCHMSLKRVTDSYRFFLGVKDSWPLVRREQTGRTLALAWARNQREPVDLLEAMEVSELLRRMAPDTKEKALKAIRALADTQPTPDPSL